jgi:hypothetical protein
VATPVQSNSTSGRGSNRGQSDNGGR